MEYIGRREHISFPEIGIIELTAKIDTGAYRSVLHCYEIEEVEIDGAKKLKVSIDAHYNPKEDHKIFYFENYYKVKVRSSNGKVQNRFMVKLKIKLGNKTYNTEFTFNNRSKMRYPVLIGRKFIKKKFLVDVSKKFLLNSK